MKDTITNYIKGCALCQSRKNNPTNPKPPLFPIPSDTYTLPFESIALDFITKLPNSQTYDTILTITDTFSKASIFIPCNKVIDSEKTALLYATYVLPHYGLPSRIISDRDPRFTSTFTKELCRLLQIDQNISTAYHPQTDGQSERTNQWLEQYLRIFTNFQQNDWVSWLPLAQYAHNSWPNATTKKAPFELIMGHIPHVHQTTCTSTSPSAETRLQNVTEVQQQVAEAIRQSQELITRTPTRFTPYCIGDKVWLDAKNLNSSHPSAKLGPKRYGPFLITAAASHTSFCLKLPPQWKIHNVFHASLLTPYNETTIHGPNFQEPPPDLINGQPEWEVEQILGARRRHNQLQYLVRWKGFSKAHDSWEPLSHINAEQLIEDFHQQNPSTINAVELITNTPVSTSPITIRRITMSSPEYTSCHDI
jgi:transposase InsO family protein